MVTDTLQGTAKSVMEKVKLHVKNVKEVEVQIVIGVMEQDTSDVPFAQVMARKNAHGAMELVVLNAIIAMVLV